MTRANVKVLDLVSWEKGKKMTSKLKARLTRDKYIFWIYKDETEWYANAESKDDPSKFFYKWTTGRTKKQVQKYIDASVA